MYHAYDGLKFIIHKHGWTDHTVFHRIIMSLSKLHFWLKIGNVRHAVRQQYQHMICL